MANEISCLVTAVRAYLANENLNFPFFAFVGTSEYLDVRHAIVSEFPEIQEARVSDYCLSDDSFPDWDGLVNDMQGEGNAFKQYHKKKLLWIGIGDCLMLRGEKKCCDTMYELGGACLYGGRKSILLLRGISHVYEKVFRNNVRIRERGLAYIGADRNCDIEIVCLRNGLVSSYGDEVSYGFKSLLARMEDGLKGKAYVCSDMCLCVADYIVNARTVQTAYDVLCLRFPELTKISSSAADESEWNALASSYCRPNLENLDELFSSYDSTSLVGKVFSDDLADVLLSFAALKLHPERFANDYIIRSSACCLSIYGIKNCLVFGIRNISEDMRIGSDEYWRLYGQRRDVLKQVPQDDRVMLMGQFVSECKDSADFAYFLTDLTDIEKKAFIQAIACSPALLDDRRLIENVYPDLALYLDGYRFGGFGKNVSEANRIRERVEDYFSSYRRQKLLNVLNDDFLSEVKSISDEGFINVLRGFLDDRDKIIREMDSDEVLLLFADDLGIEFIPFIASYAMKNNLSVHCIVAMANLPTITEYNTGFFEEYKHERIRDDKRLDNKKHEQDYADDYKRTDCATYLIDDIDAIKHMISIVRKKLVSGSFAKVVVASDHGSSRLCRIYKDECKGDEFCMENNGLGEGKHGGRCAEIIDSSEFNSDDYDNVSESVDKKYACIRDYSRFKGGSVRGVELHGGAALEEVLVPVIEFELASGKSRDGSESQDMSSDSNANEKTGTVDKGFDSMFD